MIKKITLFGGFLLLTLSLSAQCSLPSGSGCGLGPVLTGTITIDGNSGTVGLPGTYGGNTYTTLSGNVIIEIGQNTTLSLGDDLMIENGTTVSIGETNGNPIALANGEIYTKNGDPSFADLSALLSSCEDPNGCTVGSILPVALSSWTAAAGDKEDRVVLSWSSSAEDDNDYFFIEHGTDGVNFQEIARLAGRGSEDFGSEYVYEHTSLSGGAHFYRLGQRDFDGSTALFEIRSVVLQPTATLAAYPNPASPGSFVKLEHSGRVRMMDVTGKEINLVSNQADGRFLLPATVRPGVYLIRVAGKTTRLVVR